MVREVRLFLSSFKDLFVSGKLLLSPKRTFSWIRTNVHGIFAYSDSLLVEHSSRQL